MKKKSKIMAYLFLISDVAFFHFKWYFDIIGVFFLLYVIFLLLVSSIFVLAKVFENGRLMSSWFGCLCIDLFISLLNISKSLNKAVAGEGWGGFGVNPGVFLKYYCNFKQKGVIYL